jgi:hypothetical protein
VADDIVTRLRRTHLSCAEAYTHDVGFPPCDLCLERLDAAAEIERLHAERDAIDALHQPDPDYYSPRGRQMCLNCDLDWPCPTYELLHPKEARRG